MQLKRTQIRQISWAIFTNFVPNKATGIAKFSKGAHILSQQERGLGVFAEATDVGMILKRLQKGKFDFWYQGISSTCG